MSLFLLRWNGAMLKLDLGLRSSNLKKFYHLKIFLKILLLVVEICQRTITVQKGDFVVLGGATSSVGIAAIQIAKMQGANVIALSRTHAKGDVLLQKGADFVIATKEDDVTAKLLEITNGKGVNLVFDPVGGKEAAKIINAMTQDGKYIIYGALSHDDIAVPVFPILGKHLTVRGYELFEITTVPEKLAQAKKFVFDGLASGQLKPEIDKVFAFDEMAEAHRYMESNAQIGKILVKV